MEKDTVPKLTRSWIASAEILPADNGTPVKQVYMWLLSADNKVVIVSKDGESWQLPGGKPMPAEPRPKTAQREVAEETGLDISPYLDSLVCFGYYKIHEPKAAISDYLQVRYYLQLETTAAALNLTAVGESTDQAANDIIRHVEAVPFAELTRRIGWMGTSPEYLQLQAQNVIPQSAV